MTKAELIEKMLRSNDLPDGMTKKHLGEILDVAFAELASYFAKAKITRNQSPRFTYPGFGTFTKKRRAARRGVHPQTLEPLEIGGFDTLDFKPGVEFKRLLNRDRDAETTPARAEAAVVRATRRRASKGDSEAPLSPSGRRLVARDDVEQDEQTEVRLPNAPLARAVRGRAKSNTKTG